MPITRSRYVLLVFLVIAVALPLSAQRRNRDREVAAATQNIGPVPASRAEADAYNAISAAAEPARLAEADKFLAAYPTSQLAGLVNRMRMDLLIAGGRFKEAMAAGEAGLAQEARFLESVTQRADTNVTTIDRTDRYAVVPIDKNSPSYKAFLADSEMVRLYYFQRLMSTAQELSDGAKTIEFGEKAYAINPDDLFTLVTLSQTLAERPAADDRESEQSLKRAEDLGRKAAAKAAEMVSSPAGAAMPSSQKANLLIAVHSTLGRVYFTQKRYGESQKSYLAAIAAKKDDPALYLLLGLAYAKQNPPLVAQAMDALAKSAYLKGNTESQAREYLQVVYEQEKKTLEGLDQFIQAAGRNIGQ